ncbi:Oidioi.mRNA.OKI2018_I69.chr1.g3128.t1.cds [Oikopleura dioica]|uniref:Oidioi.mRNA.OKI2018_I69.chr1.g3128.t1.cds n=1 Tax=Oikopleura dioica TaxID=34765 RepID=A0ABN7SYM8_OIKDI|nr:Oidioi.mRNA.OKI2018_I69.chr1.g3128.t1.cds [Oikopleura dioica]
MFRKFDEKESVSTVTQLKSSVQKNIRNQIIDTYPTFEPYFTEIWPKKEPARLAKTHEKVEVLVVDHEPIFFKCRDSQWLPNIRLLHKYPFLLPIQQVDEGAIKFILSGADIMCPGLTSKGAFLDMETEKGAGVQVHCEGKELAIAVGTMAMTPKEIKDVNKGVGIAVNHCLNDGLWHWKHVK